MAGRREGWTHPSLLGCPRPTTRLLATPDQGLDGHPGGGLRSQRGCSPHHASLCLEMGTSWRHCWTACCWPYERYSGRGPPVPTYP